MSEPKAEHAMRRSTRGRVVDVARFALMGLAAGAAAKIADESGIGWLADLGTYPAVWVLALATIARAAPTAGASALTAGGFFTAMVGAYYAWASLALGFPWGPELLYWLTIAVLAVPFAAAAVWWALRRSGAVAGLVLAAMAAIAAGNGALLRAVRALSGDLPLEFVRPMQVVIEIAVSILLIVVFPRHHRTRWWAIGAWPPLVWLTPRMLALLARIAVG